jgi:LPPG:FO 2-phospho-L-lactate transferase
VGGAKLAAGLAAVLPPERLTIVVNTGDDFEHLGLTICPDIDSVVYQLAGLADAERGWGVAGETWQALGMLGRLGEEQWFQLGDRDLAMHIARSWRLRASESLSQVTARLSLGLGIAHPLVPMSDDLVRTMIETDAGWIDFQRYFVAERCTPVARAIRYDGVEAARPAAAFIQALARDDLAAVIFCPSNPYLSIDTILALTGVGAALAALSLPKFAISPLVGGKALKGPLGKLMGELGKGASNAALAGHYGALVNGLVIDRADASEAEGLRATGLSVTVTKTVMRTANDRAHLARDVLAAVGLGDGLSE